MVFVNSMSDLFHEAVPDDFIIKVFETMNWSNNHCFQILTKRSDRLKKISSFLKWSKNIWMGVSVENSEFLYRIHHLRSVPAALRFLSCEPLIGPIKAIPLEGIHWVIVGGESGPKSRPMKESWVESIKSQCEADGTAFFFKQWGGTQKKRNGRLLKGRTYNELPVVAPWELPV